MRRMPNSWTTSLTRLGFRRIFKRQQPKRRHGRRSLFEPLEVRQLLAVTPASSGKQSPVDSWRDVIDVAPASYSTGDFTLSTIDWSGKDAGGTLKSSGRGFGVDASASDSGKNAFQPGEYWSFTFDQAGVLTGIQFDYFTVEDADKAQLYVGSAPPITIRPQDLKGGFWRPSVPLAFKAGQTIKLVAIAPNATDLVKAEQAYGTRVAALAKKQPAEPITAWQPSNQWKVRGLHVLGPDESTRGGYISLTPPEPPAGFKASEQQKSTEEFPADRADYFFTIPSLARSC